MTEGRDQHGGFTLIETLVALAVLATGAMTILVGVERHVAATRGLEDRVVARWVAENVLAAALLDVEVAQRWTNAFGTTWDMRTEVRPLPNSGLSAVTVRVGSVSDGPGASVVALTGYMPVHGGKK